MTPSRRSILRAAALAPAALWAGLKPPRHRLLAQAYVFEQQAGKDGRPLAGAADEIFATIRRAGFHAVEITDAFFAPGTRQATIDALRRHGLALAIAYTGVALDQAGEAERSLASVAALAEVVRPLGCAAININPRPKPKGAAKTGPELEQQARALDRAGGMLRARGMRLVVHHHEPEMRDHAREWRHILRNTDPGLVRLCIDVDWVCQGGQDPLALLAEAGPRAASLHLRNSIGGVWLETLSAGDVDYPAVAALLRKERVSPYLVVELAYAAQTRVTRPLGDNLRLGREYAERVFRVRA